MIQEDHRDDERDGAQEHRFEIEIGLEARLVDLLVHVLGEDPLKRREDRIAQAVERVERSDEHRADGKWSHEVVPRGVRHVALADYQAARCELRAELRIQEKRQRDEDEPRQHAAREVDRGVLRSDDVAHAHERR